MNNLKFYWVKIIVSLSLLLVFFKIYSQVPYENLLKDYKNKGFLSDKYNYTIYQIANSYVNNTKFQGKIQINDIIDSVGLNIFIVRNDEREAFKSLECNCGSLGYKNIIVCDEKIFPFLEARLNFGVGDIVLASMSDRFQFFLTQWILGHEIGHVMLGHKVGQFYFPKQGTTSTTNADNEVNYSDREAAADSFAVKSLSASQNENAYWFWLGLSNMISSTYPTFLDKWLVSHTKASLDTSSINIEFNTRQHAPWLVRYLDMVMLLLKMFPADIVDNSGYFEAIRKKIKLITTTHSKSFPFCEDNLAKASEDEKQGANNDDYQWKYKRGADFFYTNNFSKARYQFEAGIEELHEKKEPLTGQEKRILGLFHYNMGLLFLIDNKIDSSINSLNKSLFYLDQYETYKYLSVCYLSNKNYKDACLFAHRSLALNKFDQLNYLSLALGKQKENKIDSALFYYNYAALINKNLNKADLHYQDLVPLDLIKDLLSLSLISRSTSSKQSLTTLLEFEYEYAYYLYQMEKYQEAEIHCQGIISRLKKKTKFNIDDSITIGNCYNFIGMVYNARHEKDSALIFYNFSLKTKAAISPKSYKNINFLKGQTFYNIGNLFLDSISVSSKYYELADSCYNLDSTSDHYYVKEKAKLYVRLGQLNLSENKINQGLLNHIKVLEKYIFLFSKKRLRIDEIISLIKLDLEFLIEYKAKHSFSDGEREAINNYKVLVNEKLTSCCADFKSLLDEMNKIIQTEIL